MLCLLSPPVRHPTGPLLHHPLILCPLLLLAQFLLNSLPLPGAHSRMVPSSRPLLPARATKPCSPAPCSFTSFSSSFSGSTLFSSDPSLRHLRPALHSPSPQPPFPFLPPGSKPGCENTGAWYPKQIDTKRHKSHSHRLTRTGFPADC